MEATVSTKGQIVIPVEIRRRYGIREGTRLLITDDGEKIILRPITKEYIHSVRGSLRGSGALKLLEEERREEKEKD